MSRAWARLKSHGRSASSDRRELRAARHRRLGRHRHRPRAARLARGSRSRTTRSPAPRVEAEIARFDAAIEQVRGELDGLHAARARRRAGRVRRVPRRAPDDPQRLDAVGGAERAHPRAALQRRVGADAADGGPGRAVRGDRGRVPARAQGRRRAGGRARAEAAARAAGHAADAAGARGEHRSSSRTTSRRPT